MPSMVTVDSLWNFITNQIRNSIYTKLYLIWLNSSIMVIVIINKITIFKYSTIVDYEFGQYNFFNLHCLNS